MNGCSAGYGENVITPETPMNLGGYGYFPDRVFEAIHDDLMVRALYLRRGEEELLLIVCDLLYTSVYYTGLLREAAAMATGLPVGRVMLGYTHTHCGPSLRGEEAAGYRRFLAGRVTAAAVAAKQDAVAGTELRYRSEMVEPIGYNRRYHDFSLLDPMLRTLWLERPGAAPVVLVNYACHPVVFGPVKQISADYPGEMVRQLNAAGVKALFLQGCTGDIDPVVNANRWGAGDDADLALIGGLLAARTLKCRRYAVPLPAAGLSVSETTAALPLAVPDSATAIECEAAAWSAAAEAADLRRFLADWCSCAKAKLAELQLDPFARIPLYGLRLGGLPILTLPGEPFTGYALKLRRNFPQLLIWGYANGSAGYFPTADAYACAADYDCYMICKAYRTKFPFRPELEGILLAAAEGVLSS